MACKLDLFLSAILTNMLVYCISHNRFHTFISHLHLIVPRLCVCVSVSQTPPSHMQPPPCTLFLLVRCKSVGIVPYYIHIHSRVTCLQTMNIKIIAYDTTSAKIPGHTSQISIGIYIFYFIGNENLLICWRNSNNAHTFTYIIW